MVYQFDEDEAVQLGSIGAAVMVWNLRYWIIKNKSSERHCHDGRTWTYNSIPSFRRQFRFWTENQIKSILEKLKNDGIILVGNYNSTSYDRTAWYAFKDEAMWLKQLSIREKTPMDRGKNPDGSEQKPSPIPDRIPDKKPNKESPPLEESPTRQITDAFQEHFIKACEAKPTWGAKEGQTIKRLLSSHGVGEILVAIRKYFEMDWWFAKNGERQFGAFATHFDEILSSKNKGRPKNTSQADLDFIEEAARL
jgi:hypothetical protein